MGKEKPEMELKDWARLFAFLLTLWVAVLLALSCNISVVFTPKTTPEPVAQPQQPRVDAPLLPHVTFDNDDWTRFVQYGGSSYRPQKTIEEVIAPQERWVIETVFTVSDFLRAIQERGVQEGHLFTGRWDTDYAIDKGCVATSDITADYLTHEMVDQSTDESVLYALFVPWCP